MHADIIQENNLTK